MAQRIIEKALLYDGKSGHKHNTCAYGRTQKYREGFIMLQKEWTQIQEECLWEDSEVRKRLYYRGRKGGCIQQECS